MQIRIEAATRPVARALALLQEVAEDLRPALRAIGEAVRESTQDRIRAGGPAPDGTAWPPLSPATLLHKKGPGLLRESGQLLDTISWALQGDQGVAIGSNKVYAAIHQLGGVIEKAAHSRQIRLRTDAKGNLLSQAQLGIGPKRMRNADRMRVFAKKTHKRFLMKWAEVGAHQVQIPARPFLGLSPSDETEALAILREHLREAVRNLAR